MDLSDQTQRKEAKFLKFWFRRWADQIWVKNQKTLGSDVVRGSDVVQWQNLMFCDVVRMRLGCGSDVLRERFWNIFAHFWPHGVIFLGFFYQTEPTCAGFDCFRQQTSNFFARCLDWSGFNAELKGIHGIGMHVLCIAVLPAVLIAIPGSCWFSCFNNSEHTKQAYYWARKW